jgi:hypothetical protein
MVMKNKAVILAALAVLSASCFAGNDNDAFLWFTWTIDEYPASQDMCSSVGAETVVLEEDPYGDGMPRWRMTFPCYAGVGRTGWHFESYTTTFIRFRLLDGSDAILSETSWEPLWPYPGENILEVDFGTTPHSGLDAYIDLEWTLNDQPAGTAACGNAGADTVRIEHDEDNDGTSEWNIDFSCAARSGTTEPHFQSGDTAMLRFVLLGEGSILSLTDWEASAMHRGANEISVNFVTAMPPPDRSASMSFEWMIHFIPGGDEICSWAGAASARLMVDTDADGEDDAGVDFDCAHGQGATDDIFEEGQTLAFAFALLDGSGSAVSMTETWVDLTLTAGENGLGSVNFIVGDFGPLGVALEWADSTGGTPSFGGCDFPPESVQRMGYLLRSGDGTVIEEVDMDADPVECTEYLGWAVLAYDGYELVVDGSDASGGTVWGAACSDLVVDDWEEDSNEFTCSVSMTESP